MFCALIFAMVVALFLLAAAARSNEEQPRTMIPGCKAAEESTKSVPVLTDFSALQKVARCALFISRTVSGLDLSCRSYG